MSKHDLELLEASRKTLIAPDSSLQDCVTAASILANARREAETALQTEEAARAKTLTSSHAKAADLDEVLRRHDDVSATIRRRAEIAGATETGLLNRIASMKDAEAVRQQRAYDNAVKQRAEAVAMIDPAIDQLAKIARPLMRLVASADLAIMRANKDLPPGFPPLEMVDASRRIETPEPALRELRRGRYYVEEASGRVLGAENQIVASLRKDGQFDVALPGGATAGALHTIAVLREMVEVQLTEHPSSGWPELWATSLKVPGAKFGDSPGWDIHTDRGQPAYPDEILARLDQLENHMPAEPPQPRITVKLVPADKWDAEHPSTQRKAA
jgi:hypothetical protein